MLFLISLVVTLGVAAGACAWPRSESDASWSTWPVEDWRHQ